MNCFSYFLETKFLDLSLNSCNAIFHRPSLVKTILKNYSFNFFWIVYLRSQENHNFLSSSIVFFEIILQKSRFTNKCIWLVGDAFILYQILCWIHSNQNFLSNLVFPRNLSLQNSVNKNFYVGKCFYSIGNIT